MGLISMYHSKTILSLILGLILTSVLYSQRNSSSGMYIEAGGGMNLSYFDVGGGSPGVSFQGSVLFDVHPSWRLGATMGFHRTNGTDEGTPNAGREYEYKSNLKELSVRVQYVVQLNGNSRKRQKRKLEPKAYLGVGILQVQAIHNRQLSAQENAGNFSIAPILSAGLALAYAIQNDLWLSFEGGSNISTSDFLEGYTNVMHSTSTDMFHTIMLKVVYKVPGKWY